MQKNLLSKLSSLLKLKSLQNQSQEENQNQPKLNLLEDVFAQEPTKLVLSPVDLTDSRTSQKLLPLIKFLTIIPILGLFILVLYQLFLDVQLTAEVEKANIKAIEIFKKSDTRDLYNKVVNKSNLYKSISEKQVSLETKVISTLDSAPSGVFIDSLQISSNKSIMEVRSPNALDFNLFLISLLEKENIKEVVLLSASLTPGDNVFRVNIEVIFK